MYWLWSIACRKFLTLWTTLSLTRWTGKLDDWSDFLQFSEERVPYYLFVDSLKPIELLVCFSALVRWGESGGKRVLRMRSSGCPEHRWAREHVTIRLSVNRWWNCLCSCQEVQRTAPATTSAGHAPPALQTVLTHAPWFSLGHNLLVTSLACSVLLFFSPLLVIILFSLLLDLTMIRNGLFFSPCWLLLWLVAPFPLRSRTGGLSLSVMMFS